ncbi:polysaccharide biosynthesis/export family protein [Qipengyuania citrea]|uniref:polysaccharide biosynthesis/export family protein n=1 Tax=Qipengyuania citrea TaxID=225971 RepID=UPI0032989714
MLALLLVAGCATPGPIGTDPGIEVADLAALPAPQASTLSQIRPRDVIRISVLGFPELSREFAVPSSGQFQFPLIGNVDAAERTPAEITDEIAARLRGRYVVDPQVILDITEQPGRLFTVGGEVASPGRFNAPEPMTLQEAVATAGGTSETALLSEVLIFRSVDGVRYIGVYDLKAIQRGNYPDPLIYEDDIVQVGDSPALRRIQLIAAVAPLVTTPLILLERTLR